MFEAVLLQPIRGCQPLDCDNATLADVEAGISCFLERCGHCVPADPRVFGCCTRYDYQKATVLSVRSSAHHVKEELDNKRCAILGALNELYDALATVAALRSAVHREATHEGLVCVAHEVESVFKGGDRVRWDIRSARRTRRSVHGRCRPRHSTRGAAPASPRDLARTDVRGAAAAAAARGADVPRRGVNTVDFSR
jgi:hypothetical protein